MCRACHLGDPNKAAALSNPEQKPHNNPKIGCNCTWVVGYSAKLQKASWIVGMPCATCLRMFHRVVPVAEDNERVLVIDVYGNRYNIRPEIIARAKDLEKIDS